jgi:uncharacterized protein YsxB (DUF464 family)
MIEIKVAKTQRFLRASLTGHCTIPDKSTREAVCNSAYWSFLGFCDGFTASTKIKPLFSREKGKGFWKIAWKLPKEKSEFNLFVFNILINQLVMLCLELEFTEPGNLKFYLLENPGLWEKLIFQYYKIFPKKQKNWVDKFEFLKQYQA